MFARCVLIFNRTRAKPKKGKTEKMNRKNEPQPGEMIPAKFYRREPWRDSLPTIPQGQPTKTPAKVCAGVTIETF